jgi:DNA polymerase (family 10)
VTTQRTIAAMENPYVNCIGHPTGRLINEREAMPLDIDAVCRAAARTGTALEMNANHYRLDLKDQHARRARELGVKVVINTDAHAIDQFAQMRYGVLTARRAGLQQGDVLNAGTLADLRAFVQAKRG